MKKIELTQGKFALVDDEDYDWVNRYTWHFDSRYARTQIGGHHIRLHVLLMNPGKKQEIDHKDNNSLNCQKFNLRVGTHSQNNANKDRPTKGSSLFKGVMWHKAGNKWMARIKVDKHGIYLGLFKSEKEAAVAYNEAAKKYFGEFAKLNIIN